MKAETIINTKRTPGDSNRHYWRRTIWCRCGNVARGTRVHTPAANKQLPTLYGDTPVTI